MGGIENGGWKVIYNDEPSKLEGRRGNPADAYSIGLQVAPDGTVNDSIVGSPAFEAGITSRMKVVGVNGRVYSPDLLEDAIKAAKDNSQADHAAGVSMTSITRQHHQLSRRRAIHTWCGTMRFRIIWTS